MTHFDDRGSPCCAFEITRDSDGVERRKPDWDIHYAIRAHEDAVHIAEQEGRQVWLNRNGTNR